MHFSNLIQHHNQCILAGLWDFNGGGIGNRSGGGPADADHSNMQCSSSVEPALFHAAPGNPNHYGFSTIASSCGGNWNFCEGDKTYPGGYDNGVPMGMNIFASSQAEAKVSGTRLSSLDPANRGNDLYTEYY